MSGASADVAHRCAPFVVVGINVAAVARGSGHQLETDDAGQDQADA
jgi:hypothetical protein